MPQPAPLTADQLNQLRRVPTPTVANAVERFGLHASDEGYTDASIRCIYPDLGAIVGYAGTLVIRSDRPGHKPRLSSRKPYWDHFAKHPAPRIVVSHDLAAIPRGAYFGEVNCNIHKALGCVGLVTDGAVRDLDEVRALGFPMFAAAVSVSHAYAHLEDFDVPVTVGGMTVRPGDLIHADQHGAMVVPAECIPDLMQAVQAVNDYEAPMIALAKSPRFSTQELAELLKHETV